MAPEVKIERAPAGMLAGLPAPRSEYSQAIVRLKVGQSFLVPLNRRPTMSAMAWWYGQRLGRKFSTRRDPEKKDQLRIIRVA